MINTLKVLSSNTNGNTNNSNTLTVKTHLFSTVVRHNTPRLLVSCLQCVQVNTSPQKIYTCYLLVSE